MWCRKLVLEMTDEKLKDYQLKILKVLFYGQLLLEANDDLENTPFFKQKLKYSVKNASVEVEKQIKIQLEKVFGQSNEMTINMFQQIDGFIERVSGLGLDELPLVNGMLDRYIEDPKYWKDKMVVEFNRIEE